MERLGGRKNIPLDVRVIATSNRDMRQQVALGKFREDLYFRLSVLPLQWAPLRDRKGDILPLALDLLSRHARKQHRAGVKLSAQAQEALLQYSWPGNVRELDNVMQRALILQPGESILAQDLGLHCQDTYSAKPSLLDAAATAQPAREMATADLRPSSFAEDGSQHEIDDLGSDLRHREYQIILQTLKKEGGSKKNTAERLGISPRTLRYKMARLREDGYGINATLLP